MSSNGSNQRLIILLAVLGGLIVTIGLLMIGARLILSQPSCNTSKIGATWRGVTIGISSRNDVHALFGLPDKSDGLTRSDEYFNFDPPEGYPDLTFLYGEQGEVIYIHDRSAHALRDFTRLYGYPQYQQRTIQGYLFVYENHGIVVSTIFDRSFDPDAKPFSDNTLVWEVYFQRPRSFECMKRGDPKFDDGNATPEPFTLP